MDDYPTPDRPYYVRVVDDPYIDSSTEAGQEALRIEGWLWVIGLALYLISFLIF